MKIIFQFDSPEERESILDALTILPPSKDPIPDEIKAVLKEEALTNLQEQIRSSLVRSYRQGIARTKGLKDTNPREFVANTNAAFTTEVKIGE